jgi:Concanavalin A-like lectin/glucanases superfamily
MIWPVISNIPAASFGGAGAESSAGTGLPPLARSFNGSSDYIDVGNSAILNPSAITVSCWMYWNGTYQDSGGEQWFVSRDDGSGPGLGRAYALGLVASNPQLVVQINGAFDVGGAGNLITHTWTRITFTGSSAAGYEVYLNSTGGGASNSGTSMGTTTGDGRIGNRTLSVSQGFTNGNIADVAIWNTILTSAQISSLAAGQRANMIGANANLVGYWPIVNQSPEPDYSGNGFNGTLNGTAIVAGPPALQPL